MAFIIHNGLPYYTKGEGMNPCSVDGFKIEIQEDVILPLPKVDRFLSAPCLRAKLQIILVDSWDEEKGKVIKISNKTISSIERSEEEINKELNEEVIVSETEEVPKVGAEMVEETGNSELAPETTEEFVEVETSEEAVETEEVPKVVKKPKGK